MSTKQNSRVDASNPAVLGRRVGRYLAAAAFGLSACMIVPAQAADSASAPAASAAPAKPSLTPAQRALMEDFQKTRMDLIQTGHQLGEIEKKAYEKDPALGKQREALRDSIRKKMTTKGYDAQAKYDELKTMITKIQGESGDKTAREKDIMAFQKARQEFAKRQHAAMMDPKIQKMVAKLRKDVRREMLKVDPKSKALFAKMDADQKHMQELRKKALAMHGDVKKVPPAH